MFAWKKNTNLNKRASIKDNNQDVSDFTEIYVGHL